MSWYNCISFCLIFSQALSYLLEIGAITDKQQRYRVVNTLKLTPGGRALFDRLMERWKFVDFELAETLVVCVCVCERWDEREREKERERERERESLEKGDVSVVDALTYSVAVIPGYLCFSYISFPNYRQNARQLSTSINPQVVWFPPGATVRK